MPTLQDKLAELPPERRKRVIKRGQELIDGKIDIDLTDLPCDLSFDEECRDRLRDFNSETGKVFISIDQYIFLFDRWNDDSQVSFHPETTPNTLHGYELEINRPPNERF